MSEKKRSMRFDPTEPAQLDAIIRGSYDDFVRIERRNLLAVSSLTLFLIIGKAQATSEVVFWGVKLPQIDTVRMFTALFLLCLYFSFAHIVYAYPSYRDARLKWKELKGKAMQISGYVHRWPIEVSNLISATRFYCWLFLSYIFPLALGILSTVWALCIVA